MRKPRLSAKRLASLYIRHAQLCAAIGTRAVEMARVHAALTTGGDRAMLETARSLHWPNA